MSVLNTMSGSVIFQFSEEKYVEKALREKVCENHVATSVMLRKKSEKDPMKTVSLAPLFKKGVRISPSKFLWNI